MSNSRSDDDAEEGELVGVQAEQGKSYNEYNDVVDWREERRSKRRRWSPSPSRSYSSEEEEYRRRRTWDDYDRRHRHRDENVECYDRGSRRRQLSPELEDGKGDVQEEDEAEYQARVAAALQEEQEDEEKLIEERRKRRQEILQKYGKSQNLDAKYTERDASVINDLDMDTVMEAEEGQSKNGVYPIFDGAAGDEQNTVDDENINMIPESGIGETLDEEGQKRLEAVARAHGGTAPSSDDDMDDIFADTPDDEDKPQNMGVKSQKVDRKALIDSYDDAEGYYNFQVGEIIGSKYEVLKTHGRGVFSSVLRARDVSGIKQNIEKDDLPQVAVKVIRANDTMYKAGQMERVILNKLSQSDPDGKKHCIKLLNSFEYRNHLCLVFEPMDMDLRGLTKRYGRGIGLSINAVRIYATQMLVALQHLRSSGVLHADIKPDNILVNERRTVVKICDFGSAMFSGDNEITPYLVSRFYRAPEVILGLPYDYPMDMWSIGCVIYELFTGKILFPGRSNNEMLKCMMDVKGPFPKKMLKKAEFAFKHFEMDLNMSFLLEEEDRVTKKPVRRIISNPTKIKDFAARLAGQAEDKKKLSQLVDLLERMTTLDPDKRITPLDALRHPFIRDVSKPKAAMAPRVVQASK